MYAVVHHCSHIYTVCHLSVCILITDEEMDVAFADNENDFVSLREKTYSLEYENMVSDSNTVQSVQ